MLHCFCFFLFRKSYSDFVEKKDFSKFSKFSICLVWSKLGRIFCFVFFFTDFRHCSSKSNRSISIDMNYVNYPHRFCSNLLWRFSFLHLNLPVLLFFRLLKKISSSRFRLEKKKILLSSAFTQLTFFSKRKRFVAILMFIHLGKTNLIINIDIQDIWILKMHTHN